MAPNVSVARKGCGPVMSANAGNMPTPTPLPITSSGRLTNNVLLVHSSVGKTRPSVYSLPGMNHIYGKRVEYPFYLLVLQHWHIHSHARDSTPKTLNYIAMNRGAAKEGIINPRDLRKYRKLNPIRINVSTTHGTPGGVQTVGGGAALYKKAPIPSDADPRFTYGKPTRPSTPVADLMTDRYQREWLVQQEKRLAEASRAPKKLKSWELSKTSTHSKSNTPKTFPICERDPKTLWKMSKFSSVPAHLSTWRDASDPALQFAADGSKEVFKVVDDKWLGLPPRELTRPIYMQKDFERQQRAAAVAAEPVKRDEKNAGVVTSTATKSVRFNVREVPVGAAKIVAGRTTSAGGVRTTAVATVPVVATTAMGPASVHTKSVTQKKGGDRTTETLSSIEVHAYPVADDVTHAAVAGATTDEIATGHHALGSVYGVTKEMGKEAIVKGALPVLPGEVGGRGIEQHRVSV
ncbi:hypothetical protein PhCBS80983_g05591 [Powellomyces hirtus]|uniref:Uncharacterized protein n=1 Tax=Powellomyces hirtus TaxID=109895 RepID=A0A507DV96_9FUNG|nr:hypothetical protein PhCBS80983_g05591 [Powellomyces hirtus]